MKKKYFTLISLVVFILLTAFIFLKYQRKQAASRNAVYTLLDRQGTSAKSPEWKQTKIKAMNLLQQLHANPNNVKPAIELASLYVKEARLTGNYAYYDKAAIKYVNDVLQQDSANFEALILKSLLYLSQHHFQEGLQTAEKTRSINPYSSFVYGMLVDGNVEMGYYDSAVANAERMVNIRPDLRSYSRISYLREIYGDYPGAIEAMKEAVAAGAPGDEGTEWCRIQLGRLYENTGDIKSAEMHYRIALDESPGYAYALAGLGRLAAQAKDYVNAERYYKQADAAVKDFAVKEGLATVYQLSGRTKEAKALEQEVINEMTGEAASGQNDEAIGHYVDRELAYAYLNVHDYDKALEHALLEYNRRPGNIDVNEAVAWVYYNKGDYAKAVPYIQTALKTKSRNPTLLVRAGLIFAKAGEKQLAKVSLQQALQTNAAIETGLRSQGTAVLQSL